MAVHGDSSFVRALQVFVRIYGVDRVGRHCISLIPTPNTNGIV